MSHKLAAAISLALGLGAAAVALADQDMTLPTAPTKFKSAIPLKSDTTFYDFAKGTLVKAMDQPALPKSSNDDTLVQNGQGTAVQLDETNYNFHVNYNSSPQSGRSYGWTQKSGGMVGDWSDKAYLQNLWDVVSKADDGGLTDFYSAIVELVGASSATELGQISDMMSQRVATNFLAIYTAEEYRALIPNGMRNWDDALFDVTLLAAFHAGQVHAKQPIALFYDKQFTSDVKEQDPGVYNLHGKAAKPGTPAKADLTDYWQYTANATKFNSGINETRIDFTAMGTAITQWEKAQHADMVSELSSAVDGKGVDVFEDVTEFFAQGKAQSGEASDIAKKVAAFEVQVYGDAGAISDSLRKGETAGDQAANEPVREQHRKARTPARPARGQPAVITNPTKKIAAASPAPEAGAPYSGYQRLSNGRVVRVHFGGAEDVIPQ